MFILPFGFQSSKAECEASRVSSRHHMLDVMRRCTIFITSLHSALKAASKHMLSLRGLSEGETLWVVVGMN